MFGLRGFPFGPTLRTHREGEGLAYTCQREIVAADSTSERRAEWMRKGRETYADDGRFEVLVVLLATDDGLSRPDARQTLAAAAERQLSGGVRARTAPVVRARRGRRAAGTTKDHALRRPRLAQRRRRRRGRRRRRRRSALRAAPDVRPRVAVTGRVPALTAAADRRLVSLLVAEHHRVGRRRRRLSVAAFRRIHRGAARLQQHRHAVLKNIRGYPRIFCAEFSVF